MALHLPTFFTRLGSAIVFCIIMMVGLLWNQWAFLALISLIQFLCLRDYFRLVRKIDTETRWQSWLPIATYAMGLLFLVVTFLNGENYVPALFCIPTAALLISTLSNNNGWAAFLQTAAGMVYIIIPTVLLLGMHLVNFILPVALILMIWTNDTMAYLVGSFIGKTPFSSISPKKTWEGTIGGAILTIVGAAIWGYYSAQYRMIDWIVLALCAAVAGTAGDLLESKLKRMANVKDSGTMMPGHGGALDRFDSLLVATPFAFAYVYLFV